MKIVSVVGARPEFIQAAPVSKVLRENHQEIIVHTGQHYDYMMSETFFEELEIPNPNFNLDVGSGSHAFQISEILLRTEKVLSQILPDLVIVRGDTNSTLGCSLAASHMNIPVAHIEAGERSFNRAMPEEVNRIVADHLSSIHFCACRNSVENLAAEGICDHVYWVGDVMLDVLKISLPVAREKSGVMKKLGLSPRAYSLVTIHRSGNTDDPERMEHIVEILNAVDETIVFPIHPRTDKALRGINAQFGDHVLQCPPLGYHDMVVLELNARLIATDSGGVQREAYFVGVPCLTLRDETEWVETVDAGWNLLVGTSPSRVLEAWHSFYPSGEQPPIFGEGDAALKISAILEGWTSGSIASSH